MDVLKENLAEVEVGNTVESLQNFLDLQRGLFHSQIDQFQNVVVTQCKLTGVNPLAQEMAAGALSIKIGKRPRDLLNPKAVKYMQAVFSIKDAISKKESREISALFGVTVTQVRDFFASQRTRVRKQVRLSREKALRSNACKETEDVVSTGSDAMPVEPVPLDSVGPVISEEVPSCTKEDEALTGMDELDKHFVENIFSKMRKEETFSGQVKLMEWILRMQNPCVLSWFLTKGGVMILATWLSQAAVEEQTTVLLVILKVLCHLPLQKALPEHMSAVLQSVNKLRLYRFSDISNRARHLLSRWSKMLARSQAAKKPTGLKSSTEAHNEMLLKQSISEIMGDESWQTNIDNPEGISTTSNVRKLESPQVLKLLPATTDDFTKKNIRGVSGSHSRERRKVQLVEQPGQKVAGKSSQTTRTVPVSQSRPMSADDIQKAKLRALHMQSKYGKTSSSNRMNEAKSEGLNKPSTSQANVSPPVSKLHSRLAEEQKKPVILPLKTSNRLETSLDIQENTDFKEASREKCQKVKILWHTPPEVKLNALWSVGAGDNSKEVDVQKDRNLREGETLYYSIKEIPSNPKEPWDKELDYDDTMTPEIPIEQPPDTESTEKQVVTHDESSSNEAVAAPSSSQIGGRGSGRVSVAAEPDLELLAVLLKNPQLVFALTSGQAPNMTSAETVKLLDRIKADGGVCNSNEIVKKVEERVEVSLPSPTPSTNPGTGGWKAEALRNPFSHQNQTGLGNRVGQAALGVGSVTPVAERLPATAMADANGLSLAQQLAAAMAQLLPQSQAMAPEKRETSNVGFSHHGHGLPSNGPSVQPPAPEIALTMKNLPIANTSSTNLSAAPGPSSRVEIVGNLKHVPLSMIPNAPEKLHSSMSLSPMMPTLSRQQLQPQLPRVSDPPLRTHPYSTRPLMGNIGMVPDPWRARQGMALNTRLQANQNNYNASYGESMQPQLRSGPPWEGNEYVGNEGFESWSPENSPNRTSSERVPGRSYQEPRMNSEWSYRPDRPWQQQQQQQRNSLGYREQNRQGNRKWRDRR